MIRSVLVSLVAAPVLLTAGIALSSAAPAAADEAVVTNHVDGDTFDVALDGPEVRIRLLNLDTPETKDPDRAVECLGSEASAFLAEMIPVGITVRLEYDRKRTDRYDRTLAGVFTTDGTLVNAEVARAGLGRAVVYDNNDRFLDPVQAAQEQAAAAGRGLYSSDVACTLPSQVAAVTDAVAQVEVAALTPPGASSADLQGAIAQMAAAVAAATALGDPFLGHRNGLVWAVFSKADQDQFRDHVTDALASARAAESSLTAAAGEAKARAVKEALLAAEAETARVAAEAETARAATAAEEHMARVAAEAETARVAAEAETARAATAAEEHMARVAAEAEAARTAAAALAMAETRRVAATPAQVEDAPAAATDPYPGYTGPRCYAPGGKTWKPCP